MNVLEISTEFIKLDQALKFANVVESGAFAKEVIQYGDVKVNGEVEVRRGRKLYDGDSFSFDGEEFVIKKL
ncbi:MAG: RNA-binding S4 domain-containing protein [Clostridia bacterium]|nr:RNA-binding S4 domain-containing protein [Clostridia bacterium]